MKRWLFITGILTVGIWGVWIGLNHFQTQVDPETKIKVSVSMPLLKYLAERIGGDQVSVTSIMTGPNCNHEYEGTTGDLKRVAGSDLYIRVGMDFDHWVDRLIANASGHRMVMVDASRGVTVITEPDPHQHQGSHEKEESNPHYWGDPDNVRMMAMNITAGLTEVAPGKKKYFEANYAEFDRELTGLAQELRKQTILIKNKPLVSYSAAFPYFFRFFGFENVLTVESTCEQDVSPKRLVRIAAQMKENQVKVVVGEAVYPRLPDNLAKDTGADVVLLWPSTNESGDYLATLKENVEKLVKSLQ